MNFSHPSITIEEPVPGHFVIKGHAPKSVMTDEGQVVPLDVCYITPEIPSELLVAILDERGVLPWGGNLDASTSEALGVKYDVEPELSEDEIEELERVDDEEPAASEPKRRGRPRKNA